MIALKLLFQSLAGAGSVLVCAGGGYYVMKTSKEDNFYLVSAAIESTSPASADFWTAKTPIVNNSLVSDTTKTDITKMTKNYKCISSEASSSKEDSDCEIYSIAFPSGKQAINFEQLKAEKQKSKHVIAKADLVANKFFLLKASSSIYNNWASVSAKTIVLSSSNKASNETDKDKKYATLTLHGKLTDSTILGKTNLVIAKAKDPSVNTPLTTPLSCTTSFSENTKKKCFISIIGSGTLEASKKLEDLVFTAVTIPTTQSSTTITKDSYYLINWNETNFEIKNIKKDIDLNTTDSTATTAKTNNFTIQAPVFAIPSSATPSAISQVIIIN